MVKFTFFTATFLHWC